MVQVRLRDPRGGRRVAPDPRDKRSVLDCATLLSHQGIVGDAVMLPEPLCDHLPTVGRGQACWKVAFRRPGAPVHEVMRAREEPEVITAGARLVGELARLELSLRLQSGPMGLSPSVFVGLIRSGEIYNQFPQECVLEGTRRWLPGSTCDEVDREFRGIVAESCLKTGATAEIEFRQVRDAFFLDTRHAVVTAFQESLLDVTGTTLEFGVKPFVDDGNSVWGLKNAPAITHGPRAGGPAHDRGMGRGRRPDARGPRLCVDGDSILSGRGRCRAFLI